MAEYRDLYQQLRAAGVDVLALSVDEPARSEEVRREYALPFSLLSDTAREVVQQWDLYNSRERGGIARTAAFVLDQDRRVKFRSVEMTTARVHAADMLEFLRGGGIAPPRRRAVIPGIREFGVSIWLSLRHAWSRLERKDR